MDDISRVNKLVEFLDEFIPLCNKHRIFIQFELEQVFMLPEGKFVELYGFDQKIKDEKGVFFLIPQIWNTDLDKLIKGD